MIKLAMKALQAVTREAVKEVTEDRTRAKAMAKVRFALRLATALIPKLPAKGDGLIQLTIKGLSAIDALDKHLRQSTDGLQDLIDSYGLETTTSRPFVALFRSDWMKDHFEYLQYLQRGPLPPLDTDGVQSDTCNEVFSKTSGLATTGKYPFQPRKIT